MTLIAAIKTENSIWISADSRIVAGNYKTDIVLPNDNKIVGLKHAFIGCAGDISGRNYFELYSKRQNVFEYKFKDRVSVFEFFTKFKIYLKSELLLPESQIEELEIEWLVVTENKMFVFDNNHCVLEFFDYCAIGSGAEAAKGVLQYILLFNDKLTPRIALLRTQEAVCTNNVSCGGKQTCFNASKFIKRNST